MFDAVGTLSHHEEEPALYSCAHIMLSSCALDWEGEYPLMRLNLAELLSMNTIIRLPSSCSCQCFLVIHTGSSSAWLMTVLCPVTVQLSMISSHAWRPEY